jgi:hypothetical protein
MPRKNPKEQPLLVQCSSSFTESDVTRSTTSNRKKVSAPRKNGLYPSRRLKSLNCCYGPKYLNASCPYGAYDGSFPKVPAHMVEMLRCCTQNDRVADEPLVLETIVAPAGTENTQAIELHSPTSNAGSVSKLRQSASRKQGSTTQLPLTPPRSTAPRPAARSPSSRPPPSPRRMTGRSQSSLSSDLSGTTGTTTTTNTTAASGSPKKSARATEAREAPASSREATAHTSMAQLRLSCDGLDVDITQVSHDLDDYISAGSSSCASSIPGRGCLDDDDEDVNLPYYTFFAEDEWDHEKSNGPLKSPASPRSTPHGVSGEDDDDDQLPLLSGWEINVVQTQSYQLDPLVPEEEPEPVLTMCRITI